MQAMLLCINHNPGDILIPDVLEQLETMIFKPHVLEVGAYAVRCWLEAGSAHHIILIETAGVATRQPVSSSNTRQ